jgi:hypothetical protein
MKIKYEIIKEMFSLALTRRVDVYINPSFD